MTFKHEGSQWKCWYFPFAGGVFSDDHGPVRHLTEMRKLEAALLEHMGVRAEVRPQLGPVIALPWRRDGKPCAGRFRAVERKDWRFTLGVSRGLCNEDSMRGGGALERPSEQRRAGHAIGGGYRAELCAGL